MSFISFARRHSSRSAFVLAFVLGVAGLLGAALGGCAVVHHPAELWPNPASDVSGWDEVFAAPGVLSHEAVISARWSVPLSGVLNLQAEAAASAALKDEDTPIVLPVHVLTHPDRGTFIIDTGVPKDLIAHGVVGLFLKDLRTIEPVEDIVARQSQPLAGVLMTHFHLDHVLGLAGLPPQVPVYVGPGELEVEKMENAFTRSTYEALLEKRAPLRTWRVQEAQPLGPIKRAIDVFGDRSLWALHMPGHTPGSMAYLAQTKDGPILFTGDTSHTLWGVGARRDAWFLHRRPPSEPRKSATAQSFG